MRSLQAEVYRKLYQTSDWKKLRKAKLLRTPMCERCLAKGIVEIATVAHHRTAHKGDTTLFFDIDNLESLCAPHHDGDAQSEDKIGYSGATDNDGWPTDPRHPVNKRAR